MYRDFGNDDRNLLVPGAGLAGKLAISAGLASAQALRAVRVLVFAARTSYSRTVPRPRHAREGLGTRSRLACTQCRGGVWLAYWVSRMAVQSSTVLWTEKCGALLQYPTTLAVKFVEKRHGLPSDDSRKVHNTWIELSANSQMNIFLS